MEESYFLPSNMVDARIKDILLAEVLNNQDLVDSLTSPEAALKSIGSYLEPLVISSSPEKAEELVTEIADKVALFIISKSPKEATKLMQSIYIKKASARRAQPMFVLHNQTLSVRVPNVDPKNEGQILNLAKTLSFAMKLFKVPKEGLKIYRHSELGNSVHLLSKIERTIDLLESALLLPASQAGDAIQFESGFKANLPEILAAIKVARRNSNLVRKTTPAKDRKVVVTTADILRKSFNIRSGFEESGADPWVVNFLRAILAEVTKPYTQHLPGDWMHSLRVRNETNSDVGIMAKMGWAGVSPAPIKVHKVLLTRVVKKKTLVLPKSTKGKTVIGRGTEIEKEELVPLSLEKFPEGMTFREYRAALTLVLPLINPKENKSLKDQLSGDSLTPRSPSSLAFYKENKEIVDALNIAFAIMTAIPKKDRKAEPSHFEHARNHLINLTAEVGFQDANGKEYRTYLSIPEHIRLPLEKFFNRLIKAAEEEPMADNQPEALNGESPEIDETQTLQGVGPWGPMEPGTSTTVPSSTSKG
jgi:hypothetical protein